MCECADVQMKENNVDSPSSIRTSAHLHIFTFAHLHIFTSVINSPITLSASACAFCKSLFTIT